MILHPLDAALQELGLPDSGLKLPPDGWEILQEWGLGYALHHRNGLCVLIDCERKDDDFYWVHVSVSRAKATPSHDDMCLVKRAFLGDRYAYAVHPPQGEYVNIHAHCLHLWARVDNCNGMVLPEFSGIVPGVGKSI